MYVEFARTVVVYPWFGVVAFTAVVAAYMKERSR